MPRTYTVHTQTTPILGLVGILGGCCQKHNRFGRNMIPSPPQAASTADQQMLTRLELSILGQTAKSYNEMNDASGHNSALQGNP